MEFVRNDQIQFVTMRSPGSRMPTATRQIKLTGPDEAIALASSGKVETLERLVPLLADAERAWAAEVMLAAMTGNEADIVNSYAARPDEFFEAVGKTAQERWRVWLDENRSKLAWNAEKNRFDVQ